MKTGGIIIWKLLCSAIVLVLKKINAFLFVAIISDFLMYCQFLN